MKQNRGYTLIEVIIVIAIMAILTGMSFVTLGIIRNAKAQAAATTLSDQIGSLLTKTRALSEAKGSRLCLKIEYNDADVTFADNTTAKAGSYSLILGYHDETAGTFTPKVANKADALLPNIITIEYQTKDQTPCSMTDTENMYIEFNKSNGSVRYGAGSYAIKYDGRVMSYVVLDSATGNHYVTGKDPN